jgi:hypothetical protein
MLDSFQKVLWRRNLSPRSKEERLVEDEAGCDVVVTSLRDMPDEEIYRTLRKSILRKPKVLRWELIAFSGQSPDTCLLIWELLKIEKDPSTHLVVKVGTSICDAQLLFVVAADEVIFAPNRCFRFASGERFENLMQRAKKFDSDFVEQVSENPIIFEYRRFLEILDQYLPVDQLADRVWPFEKLKEFGLGVTTAEENSFRALFGND